MDDTTVIKLPVADHKKTAMKRSRPPRLDPEEEEQLRQQNLKRVAVLGEEDDSVKRLETLVFGAEEELLERLVEMKKCLHANSARPSEDKLTTVQFHPSAQVVMTAGIDQSVSLFQVDGKTNPKIQSIHLERFPVHKAQFSQDGETVIATSLRNKMFYLYDMMEGRVISASSVQTNEVVCSMKINGDVSGVAFSRDGSKVFEACLNSSNPKPLRAVMNLLTSATSLRFNPTSEILAIASRVEDEAVRLVHLSSLTVFSNFPIAKRKVAYRASCLDFSPHSGFFSLANNKGHAPLFR
ncbi:hypothetical protein GOODEAATRI_025551 [Goodea atripinnis]|uniref:UTP18 small subunit processome component n=1 Tax=Goodea atripinnis TaxID=208336 RepID=A0ABV0MKQ0_9TELE